MRAMSRALALALLAALGCGTHTDRSAPAVPGLRSAPDYATATRPARGPLEQALAAAPTISFDPALDCVAAGLTGATLDPRRYRHELPLACGSPLLVVDARVVTPATVDAALAELSRRLPGPDPIALGTAAHADGAIVVAARRTVALTLPRAGATRIAGELLVAADALRLYQATAAGVEVRDVPVRDRRFSLDIDPGAGGAADLELAIVVGPSSGPVARLRLGAGAGLVDATASAPLPAVNDARRRLGRPPLAPAGEPGDCDDIPPAVGGVDITDRAHCVELWSIESADLAAELGHRPLALHALLEPEVALVQYAERALGPTERGVAIRALRRFAVMTPAEGRERALALLRRRWPDLPARQVASGELAAILADVPAQADDGALATLKPRVDRVAAGWTTTRHYYSGLTTARDLEAALGNIQPAVTPLAIDLALVQKRGPDGAMRHVVAFVLELPPGGS